MVRIKRIKSSNEVGTLDSSACLVRIRRTRSFVVINMENVKSVDECLKEAVIYITKREVLFQYIINKIYQFLSYLFFLNYFYYRSFSVEHVIVKYTNDSTDHTRLIHKHKNGENKLIVKDNGIKLYDYFVPYECILKFGYVAQKNNLGLIVMDMFGNVDSGDKTITVSTGTDKIVLSFKIKNGINIIDIIRSNMYYHLKYNKVNRSLLKKLI